MRLTVKVIPNAKKTEITEDNPKEAFLKVRLSCPPVDGAANKELVKLLSKHFGVSKSKVKIIKGEKSREKIVEIDQG
ncbi:MAG: YggU family protein [Deltaproteobacteria bacterium]|nr:YggU family protein [Deltaproteobacteria bacterium]